MYFLAFLQFTSILSFQTNSGLSFPPNLIHVWNEFTVRAPGFASLCSLYSFPVSKTKKKLKVEEVKIKIKSRRKAHFQELQVTVMTSFSKNLPYSQEKKSRMFSEAFFYNVFICKNYVLTLIQYGNKLPSVWQQFAL